MGSNGSKVPRVVWWIAVVLSASAIASLVVPLLARSGILFRVGDPLLVHCVYALCMGALGGCVNAGMALAKHIAAKDFKAEWNLWYFSKPPLAAILGLVSFILAKGFGTAMGGMNVNNAFGIAALAFVAGFATERVVHKVEDLSKTLFATKDKTPPLAILEPFQGKTVGGKNVLVVAQTNGNVSYMSASCKEQPDAAAALAETGEGRYRGEVPLSGAAGERTVHVTGVIDGKTAHVEMKVTYAP